MRNRQRAASCRGFTYLGLMFVIAVLAMTATMASVLWRTVQQRADEHELAFIGQQFAAAIERYRQRPFPGQDGRYPARLEDLLRDARELQIERPLRRLYLDPMTGRPQWGLVRLPDGGIVGVHSLSKRAPMPGTLLADRLGFTDATSYLDWRFIAPSAQALLQPGGAAASAKP